MQFENFITLTKVSDGRDSSGYFLETNFEELAYFYNSNGGRDFFPTDLEFTLLQEGKEINFNGNFKLDCIDSDKIVSSLIGEEHSLYYEFGQAIGNRGETSNGEESQSILEAGSDQDLEQERSRTNTLFYYLQNLVNASPSFLPEKAILRFTYLQNGEPVFIKTYPIAPRTSKAMAEFNINAGDINATVAGKTIKFSPAGMEFFGSGLTIYQEGDADSDTEGLNRALYFNPNTGRLVLAGSLDAADGYFRGKIEAREGEIGGFKIEEGYLESIKKDEEPYIQLNGNEGTVYAKNLTLGEGANVESSVRLGGATLYNPARANGKVLESGATTIYDNGLVSFNNIKIDGANSKIYANDTAGAETWSLTPERAVFNNIVAKGEIESAIFKTNSVQAAGGAMIFRPSYKVVDNSTRQSGNYIELELEEPFVGAVWSKIWIVDGKNQYHEGAITQIKSEKQLTIALDSFSFIGDSFAIIDLGRQEYYLSPDLSHNKETEYYENLSGNYVRVDNPIFSSFEIDEASYLHAINGEVRQEGGLIIFENSNTEENEEWFSLVVDENDNLTLYQQKYYEYESPEPLIGINSGMAPVNNILYGQGLTLTTNTKKIGSSLPDLFLGNLAELGEKFSGYGYGLYANSAYLNGTLTTEVGDGCYAGISTTFNATANLNGDNSKIIFWAGAKSSNNSSKMQALDIQEAPFQVTQNGTVYASQAVLSGSLLVGGEVRGTDIYAAKIHGWNDESGESAALTIFDTGKGIVFKGKNSSKTSEENSDFETFSIGANGLKSKEKNFISIKEGQVDFIGNSLSTFGANNGQNFISLEICQYAKTRDSAFISGKEYYKKIENLFVKVEEDETFDSKMVYYENLLCPALIHHQNEVQSCGFYFENGKTYFQIEDSVRVNYRTIWNDNETKMIGQFSLSNDEQQEKMQYKPVLDNGACIGYNLFII